MSIAHRITGAALYFGALAAAAWLAAMASGGDAAALARDAARSLPGQAVLFLATWALFHHMLGGMRHLLWDTGRGYSLPAIEWLARGTLAGGLLLNLLFWAAL